MIVSKRFIEPKLVPVEPDIEITITLTPKEYNNLLNEYQRDTKPGDSCGWQYGAGSDVLHAIVIT